MCGAVAKETWRAREMMFGLMDEHRYAACKACAGIQIVSIPSDLGRYYDERAYYSLRSETVTEERGRVRAWIGNRLDRAQIFDDAGLAGLIARKRKNPVAERLKSYIGDSPVRSWDARILDVGCGSGGLVMELAMHGFSRVQGLDPYMPRHTSVPDGGPRLRRASLADVQGETFDVILLTHVLEHLDGPATALQMIARILAPSGVCRVEVPVADSEACRVYGKDWVELDPPRHLHVPTRRSVGLMAVAANLEIYRSEPAGSGFEFWGSEMYRRGLTLFDHTRTCYREPGEVFTREELAEFDRRALAAAARGESGRESFYLRHFGSAVPARSTLATTA